MALSRAVCKYSALVGGVCGSSSENPANVECVTIAQCTKDVQGHLTYCRLSDHAGADNKSKLLLARAGKVFNVNFTVVDIVTVFGAQIFEAIIFCRRGVGFGTKKWKRNRAH